ncbi:MAG: hypothetical protein ACREMF_01450 [Gemmatimonadales bacterium]
MCRRLLAALDASEGRRRKRKRDTTPDTVGIDLKRSILDAVVRDDPDPDAFEGWLLERTLKTPASGPARAMGMSILEEWRLALASTGFREWLEDGAPSDDTGPA